MDVLGLHQIIIINTIHYVTIWAFNWQLNLITKPINVKKNCTLFSNLFPSYISKKNGNEICLLIL